MKLDDKIKKELRLKLEDVHLKQYNKTDFIDIDLMELMAEVTTKTGFEVAVVLNRKGVLVDIFVGNKNSVAFDLDFDKTTGFNGYRVFHTHPNGSSDFSMLDKSALTNALYDSMVAIGVLDGELTTARAGFVRMDEKGDKFVDEVLVHNPYYINKFGLFEKLTENEREFKKMQSKLHENSQGKFRAVLVIAEIDKNDNAEKDLEELEGLATTLGIEVVDKLWQKRGKPDPRYMIGEGKLEELRQAVQNSNANLVVFDNVLQGSKQSNLVAALGVDVVDRSRIILDIFAKRAKTNEGKLQVELAQLKYLLPRVGNMLRGNNDGGSGIGLKGPGESKIELNRRIIENNILKLQRELDNVKKNRGTARQNRMKGSKSIVSLVGYTNSGKSTLMNTLSGAGVYEKDELFATLDTTTRNVWLNHDKQFLLVDTVGFINKLPHEFIAAFSSTLEESLYADLLLHVVDASNVNYQMQIDVVNKVLSQIGVTSKIVLVYNKIDKVKDKVLDEIKKTAPEGSVFISAKRGINLQELKALIETIV